MSNIILWSAGAYLGVGAVVLWRGRLVAFQHFAVARSVGEPWFKQAAILALCACFLVMVWPFAVRWLFDPRERQRAAFEREWAGSMAVTRQEWTEGTEAPDAGFSEQSRREHAEFKRRYRPSTLITPFGRGTVWTPIERSDRDGEEG